MARSPESFLTDSLDRKAINILVIRQGVFGWRWLFYQPTQYGSVRGVANQNRVLSVIKGFFKFLKREAYLARDPAEGLEHAREPRSLPRNVLTPQEARCILESIDTSYERGYRDRTLMEVFYATGLRRSELLNLTVPNVNEVLCRRNNLQRARGLRRIPEEKAALETIFSHVFVL